MIKKLQSDHDRIRKTLNLLEAQFLKLCRGEAPNYSIVHCVLVYIQEYPEQVHHPLEDAIFATLIERGGKAGKIARDLVKDHTELESITRTMRESLELVMAGKTVEETELKQQLSTFLTRQRRHLYAEEDLVYPLINELLTDQDLQKIGKSMASPVDPVFDGQAQGDHLLLFRELQEHEGVDLP